jgi:3-deoxy-D-manno-octulosonic-acid transferase
MDLSDLAYRSAVRAIRFASPALARGESKLARGVRGRRGAAARLVDWASECRDPARPLLWIHAPSVGEGLQARAVLEVVKALDPSVQTVFTHFSPSAESLARAMGADASDYLPWDVQSEVGPLLDVLRPSLLAFTKTEVWPVLAREAEARGVRLWLIGATLPEGSSRLSPVARSVLRPAFARLGGVHAVAAADVVRFSALGVPAARVTVTGDPGIDSAAERAADFDPDAPHLRVFGSPRSRVVAGSTWPADEAVLLPACRLLREGAQRLQLVIVPHEPTPDRVRALLERLREDGWDAASLSAAEAEGIADVHDAVVVDRVGVLAQLYTVASVAYVGGGFHDKGLHSVLEPAAAGTPVCFGPRHRNAHAAGELVTAGGARIAEGAGVLFQTLLDWLGDEKLRRAAGQAALAYVESHRGAARRSAALLLREMAG